MTLDYHFITYTTRVTPSNKPDVGRL